MMILPIILIAGAVYMNKEIRLTFVRWVSDSHQIADAHVGKFEERNIKFRFSLLSSLLKEQRNKIQLQPCRVVDNSFNILNERFARGEISENEYVRVRSALNNR